jgi:predicted oxidoreductase
MFENQSEIQEEVPEKVQGKIDKMEDTIVHINLELKDKNEKLVEMMIELDELKIQVFARDKSIQLQQNQIEELLEELRESKSLENDVKILIQKKMALQDENEKLREELE